MNQQIPATRSWAAWTFLGYGLVSVTSATIDQMYNDWAAASDYPLAVIHAVGVVNVAWGLWQQTRWVWWLALGWSLLWCIAGALALVASRPAVELWPGIDVTRIIAFPLALATVVLLLIPVERPNTDDTDGTD